VKGLTSLLKKLQFRQFLSVFVIGLLLIASTAFSGSGSIQGTNNPYKNGGDGYTNYNMSTDPKVSGAEASLMLGSQTLIARNQESEILYPGAETPAGRVEKEAELPIKTLKDFQQPKPGGLIQREPNLGDRVGDRIGTVKETVKEASEFLNEKASEASQRPELMKNPAKGR
jgi:hypothetical protein